MRELSIAICLEASYQYDLAEIRQEAAEVGLDPDKVSITRQGWYSLHGLLLMDGVVMEELTS